MSFKMIDTFTWVACGGRGINRRGWDGRPSVLYTALIWALSIRILDPRLQLYTQPINIVGRLNMNAKVPPHNM